MRTLDSQSDLRGELSATARGTAAACFIVAMVFVVGCKPASEPPRQEKHEGLVVPAPVAVGGTRPAPPTGADFEGMPTDLPSPTLADPAMNAADPEETDVVDAEEATPESEIETLLKAVSPELEDTARALNTAGLKKHRKQDLRGAAASYREALEAWPGHTLARYNLACALALLGEQEASLAEIKRLWDMKEAGSDVAEILAKARVDADLTSLRDDPRFRTITGSTEIIVSFSRGDADAEASARRAHTALENAQWPAKLGGEDALEAADGPYIEALESDLVATKEVTAIGRLAGITRVILVPRMASGRIRLVFPATVRAEDDGQDEAGDDPATEPAVPAVVELPSDPAEDQATLDAFFGPRLTAAQDDKTHQLQLKTTGFFEWRITDSSGRLEVRTGRYRTSRAAIAFTFRRTVTTPVEGEGQPDIAVDEEQTAEHQVSVTDGMLVLDGLKFHR